MGNIATRQQRAPDESNGKVDPSSSYTLGLAGDDTIPEIPLVHSQPVLAICPADSTHTITATNDNVLCKKITIETEKNNILSYFRVY